MPSLFFSNFGMFGPGMRHFAHFGGGGEEEGEEEYEEYGMPFMMHGYGGGNGHM
jgi:hypothetical protein